MKTWATLGGQNQFLRIFLNTDLSVGRVTKGYTSFIFLLELKHFENGKIKLI